MNIAAALIAGLALVQPAVAGDHGHPQVEGLREAVITWRTAARIREVELAGCREVLAVTSSAATGFRAALAAEQASSSVAAPEGLSLVTIVLVIAGSLAAGVTLGAALAGGPAVAVVR